MGAIPAFTEITQFLLGGWLAFCLPGLLDDWAGHFSTNTTNTATDFRVCLTYLT